MSQIIHTGIVVNIDYAGHPDMAQVRIPILHGVPCDLLSVLNSYAANGALAIKLFKNSSYDIDTSTTALTTDKDLPWFPVVYPFGSKMGPVQGDVVYIIMETTEAIEGIVIGWTGHQVVYQTMGNEIIDSSSFIQSTTTGALINVVSANN